MVGEKVMKFRTAKKILWSSKSAWTKRFKKLRPIYYDDGSYMFFPSRHDLFIVIKAVKVLRNHVKRNKKKWNL